jgi:hypothetical protein
MNKTRWIVAALCAAGVVTAAIPAAAADAATVGVGYQYLRFSSGGETTSIPAGFMAGVAVPLQSPWSVVAEFGWNRKTESGEHVTDTSYGGGLRFRPATTSQFVPYVQAVAGIDHLSGHSDANHFMLQPGVGAMFGLASLGAFVEADYRWVHATGGSANNVALRAGLVFNVGKK